MKGYVKFLYNGSYSDDFSAHTQVYGRAVGVEKKRNYYPFCLLKEAIATFYKCELEYQERKKKFWMDKHEQYYFNEVTKKSLMVLRFTIAAAVGEARHFKSRGSRWTQDGESAEDYAKAKQYMALLMGGVGFNYVPTSRTVIYRSYVDESSWLRYLVATHHIFDKIVWDGAYGGKKWAKGCEHAIRLYRSLCGGTFSDVVIYFDTLINHFHNGGLLLNKFNCGSTMTLESLLNRKQEGDFSQIDEMVSCVPCFKWQSGTCREILRCKPLTKLGGSNGKKKEEEWWVSPSTGTEEDYEEEEEDDEEAGCGDPSCSLCYPQDG